MSDKKRKLGEYKVKPGRDLREITKLKRLKFFSMPEEFSLFYRFVN